MLHLNDEILLRLVVKQSLQFQSSQLI